VVEIVERTGVQEVHFAAQKLTRARVDKIALSSMHGATSFGVEPDMAKIEGVLNALVKAGLR